MHKALKLLENRENIIKAAEAHGIHSLCFYKSMYESWDEEADFVDCLASIDQPPDALEENTRGNLLTSFEQAVEKMLGFKLQIAPLDTQQAVLENMPPEVRADYQKMLDAAIPFEELSPTLLAEQFEARSALIEKKVLKKMAEKEEVSAAAGAPAFLPLPEIEAVKKDKMDESSSEVQFTTPFGKKPRSEEGVSSAAEPTAKREKLARQFSTSSLSNNLFSRPERYQAEHFTSKAFGDDAPQVWRKPPH